MSFRLVVEFTGVNAYIPRPDEGAILVVMVDATKIGNSPQCALDGDELDSHLPVAIVPSDYLSSGRALPGVDEKVIDFYGCRLRFEVKGANGAVSFEMEPGTRKRFMSNRSCAWAHVEDGAVLFPPRRDIGAQVVIDSGMVEWVQEASPCARIGWSEVFGGEVRNDLVQRLRVTWECLDSVCLVKEPFSDFPMPPERIQLVSPCDGEELFIELGNLCAESVTMWPSSEKKELPDKDFKWLYYLSGSKEMIARHCEDTGKPLPIPTATQIPYPVRPWVDDWGWVDTVSYLQAGGGGRPCQCTGVAMEAIPFDISEPIPTQSTTTSAPATSVILSAKLRKQEQDRWCWASVAQAVQAHITDASEEQCEIASKALRQRFCCSHPKPCDRTMDLARALDVVGHLDRLDGALSIPSIAESLNKKRPIGCRLTRRRNGHFVLISGFVAGSDLLQVEDPDGGDLHFVPHAKMGHDLNWKNWTHSYLTR